eukprot:Nk52_evm1s65 gene=Nk52_evmTU1s65
MADLDDLPPPLEDMTEALQLSKSRVQGNNKTDNPFTNTCQVQEIEIDKRGTETKKKSSSSSSSGGGGLSGFKKGFFLSGSNNNNNNNNKSKKTVKKKKEEKEKEKEEEIPFIRGKKKSSADNNSGKSDDPLVLPEVQANMNQTMEQLRGGEWVTEDVLKKMVGNPKILKAMNNPHFGKILDLFQKNPQQAIKDFGHLEEFQVFMKEFCGIMGNHFEGMAKIQEEEEEKKKKKEMMLQKDPKQAAEEALKEVLKNDPEKQKVFSDPESFKLLTMMRESPAEAQ